MATASQVTALYQKLLGRKPDAAGLNYWVNSGQPLSTISSNISAGQEAKDYAKKQEITSYYRTILGREPDAAGLNYWMNSGDSLSSIKTNIQNVKTQETAAEKKAADAAAAKKAADTAAAKKVADAEIGRAHV